MRERYPDAMRENVLIEYGRARELRARAEALGIRVICSADSYPERSEGEAFDAFLRDLGTEVKGIDAGGPDGE